MSQLVKSQLSPVQMIMDSSQAAFRSAEGSTALFEFAGGDTEMIHSETL